jgi:hypothetical protein
MKRSASEGVATASKSEDAEIVVVKLPMPLFRVSKFCNGYRAHLKRLRTQMPSVHTNLPE